MQFHHHGYVSRDPRIQSSAGFGTERATELPDNVDVLVVGSGPAGMLLAAQLSQFPTINTRIIEARSGRLEIGQADGIQARSVETFQAFGFAEEITAEAYRICEMNFWTPSADDPSKITRSQRTPDDPKSISEFPHLIVNQARVLDYFAREAKRAPGKVEPDYGIEFVTLSVGEGEYPVTVTVKHNSGPRAGETRKINAKYVVGCDGARSRVREAIGRKHIGESALHAWGVMDTLAVTDFPDIRMKCAIQSKNAGSILLIPREGGHLFRLYVDLGVVAQDNNREVRKTPLEAIIEKANAILHPYTLDVKNVPWWSVYEVGHRVTDKFDDVAPDESHLPHVFICGDACHTHSAKAGQGMNVSMQDGFNLGWKLAAVLTNRSPESLLETYSAERQIIAQNLIKFDREWSTMMAKKPEDFDSAEELSEFYLRTIEFPAGFMTQYTQSMIIGSDQYQTLAQGFPIGKRFKSAKVTRVCDAVPCHLGHSARADGRWRIYAFADENRVDVNDWAEWMLHSDASPQHRYTAKETDQDAVFDVKVIYQEHYHHVDMGEVPCLFKPQVGPFELIDSEKVFAINEHENIFTEREISKSGALVVVRPDQYVAAVLPLDARQALNDFFAQNLIPVA